MLFDVVFGYFYYYLNMFALALLSFLICAATCDKQPILSLSLTLNSNRDIQTNFAIGSSRVRVSIDINYASVDVCCKNSNTIIKKVFYFMVNPFKQTEDYRCKNSLGVSKENDTAIFEKIGPLNVQFNEVMYPACTIGKLGFGKKSQFLSLLPASQRFYSIEQENEPETKGYHWKLVVGGQLQSQFVFFPTLPGEDWRVQMQTISFNDYPFSDQTLKLISDKYHLAIPSKIYSFVQRELIINFQCVDKNHQIYCPCTGGISSSFPKFKIQINSQYSLKILEGSYLIEKDEVCSTILKQSESQNWEINILLFDNVDILFDYDQKRIGLANHRKSISTNQVNIKVMKLINQPLQIILNSAVILLMCLFVAMILIELIKYLTSLEDASNEPFETYMLKRAE